MADRLRSAVFALFFYGLSVPIVLLAPVAGLFGRRAMRRYATFWASLQGILARSLVGVRNRVEGVIPPGPVIFAAKHQSFYETFELAVMLGEPAVVLKEELLRIPLWGVAARRYGVIPVNRASSSKALRAMLKDARAEISDGRSILIFPEGTRVARGEAPPLKSGLAGLYRMLDLPVVPIAIDSGRVCSPRGPVRPGVVTFRFGEPIPPGLPRELFEAAVHREINALEP